MKQEEKVILFDSDIDKGDTGNKQMNNENYDIVNDPHNLHQPDPPMNRRPFAPLQLVPVKSNADGKIILEDGCWLQFGRRRWLYSLMEGDDFRFVGRHASEAERLDKVDQSRVFSYSEIEAFIQAGFLYMNKPMQMSMPTVGPQPRNAR